MEEKKILPKGKQELTDDELSRISGGEEGGQAACPFCGKWFPNVKAAANHAVDYHTEHKEPYNPDYIYGNSVQK